MKTKTWLGFLRTAVVLALALAVGPMGACGPSGSFTRLTDGNGGSPGLESDSGTVGSGGTDGTPEGSGGSPVSSFGGSGEPPGSGGLPGSGGSASGGSGAAGQAGTTGTGGSATGGNGTGGAATGGATATGGSGSGSGGRGTGGSGAGTGGAGTGGAGTGGAGTGGAPAQRIISIDFVGGPGALPTMSATETAGFKPAKNWNSAATGMGTLTSLTYSDGTTATGATATWKAPMITDPPIWWIGYADAPGDVRMMNGYLDARWDSAPATAATMLTVSGLSLSGGYDVYVYTLGSFAGTNTRTYAYTINTTTFTVAQTGPVSTTPTSPFKYTLAPNMGAGNYVAFKQVTGTSFVLSVKGVGATDGIYRTPVNGIQIVWPSGS